MTDATLRGSAATNIRDYLDWSAILGGAFVAAAISTIMTSFGAALGLSLTSPLPEKGVSSTAAGITIALWVIWIGVSSFTAGGYIAGRLRHRTHDATEHESNIRDGAQGLIVWAVGTLMLACIATTAIGSTAKTVTDLAGRATGGVLSTMADKANVPDPFSMAVDRLSRGTAQNAPSDQSRGDIGRVLSRAITSGNLDSDDRTYLAGQLAARGGISQADAEKRVDDTVAQLKSAVDQARQAAEKARKYGILIAFLTAASLLLSGAAAWSAAVLGGNHRDQGVFAIYRRR